MYNVLREVTTQLFALLLMRLFGPLAPIYVSGATTADSRHHTPHHLACQWYTVHSCYHISWSDSRPQRIVTCHTIVFDIKEEAYRH